MWIIPHISFGHFKLRKTLFTSNICLNWCHYEVHSVLLLRSTWIHLMQFHEYLPLIFLSHLLFELSKEGLRVFCFTWGLVGRSLHRLLSNLSIITSLITNVRKATLSYIVQIANFSTLLIWRNALTVTAKNDFLLRLAHLILNFYLFVISRAQDYWIGIMLLILVLCCCEATFHLCESINDRLVLVIKLVLLNLYVGIVD